MSALLRHTHGLVGVVMLVAGCGETLPIQYETEHLRIGTNFEHPLCQGDLEHYEQVIARVEGELGVRMDHVVEVYVWDQQTWGAEGLGDGLCGRSYRLNGCYNSVKKRVTTSINAIDHELVHAAMGKVRRGAFFDEGLAEIYSSNVPHFAQVLPSENRQAAMSDLDYNGASHFLAWLRDEWGADKLGDLIVSREDVDDAFVDILGISFSEAEERYLNTSPAIYAPLFHCDAPMIPANVSGFHAGVSVDCDSSDTRGWSEGMFVARTIDLEESGRYSLMTTGAWVNMYRCSEGGIEEAPTLEEQVSADVPADYMSYNGTIFRNFTGGVVHDVDLVAGRYHLSIGIDGHDPGSASVSVWPSIAPQPAAP